MAALDDYDPDPCSIGLGVLTAYLPVEQQPRRSLLEIHKSIGVAWMALFLVRIGWRWLAGELAYRQPLDRMTRMTSKEGHAALNAMMFFILSRDRCIFGRRLFAAVIWIV